MSSHLVEALKLGHETVSPISKQAIRVASNNADAANVDFSGRHTTTKI